MKKICEKVFYNKLTWFLAGFCVWLFAHWGILSQKYIFSHDSFYWYGIFHYFAEAFYDGFWPTWNPYLHCGEKFFQNIGMFGLLDPINILGLTFGKVLNIKNLLFLYELTTFLKLIFIALGIQLLLDYIIPEIKKYNYFSFFIILLSSFSIHSYHQNGVFLVFSYTPFILLFLLKFLDNPKWFNAIMLGYFSGICFQSMHFFYNLTFIILFTIFYFIFNKEKIKVLIDNKLKVAAVFLLFLLFSFPAWSLIFYKTSLYPYARLIFNPAWENPPVFFNSPEQFINSDAAFGEILDFFSLGFLPFAKYIFQSSSYVYTNLFSEVAMFIGTIPFLLGILGVFKGENKYKKFFLTLCISSGFLFLGPKEYNFIYKFLFYLIPPLRGIENTHEFVNYFLFSYIYFICLGILLIKQKFSQKKIIISTLFIFSLFEFCLYSQGMYNHQKSYTCLLPLKGSNDFILNNNFKIHPRALTILPVKEFPYNYNLNFIGLIKKESVSSDFISDFDNHTIVKRWPPTALTYPLLYSKILKAEISPELKDILFGINLPVFSFYSKYNVLEENQILNPANENFVIKNLSDTVLLSNINDKKLLSNNLQAEKKQPKIEIVTYKPNNIKLIVKTTQNGILLFRDGYDDCWKAKNNGKNTKIFQANYNSKAIFVKKGLNVIEFKYQPIIYSTALILYALGSLAIIIYVSFLIIRSKI